MLKINLIGGSLILSLICAFNAAAEDLSYLPGVSGDPVMMSAQSCESKPTKNFQKTCKKIGKIKNTKIPDQEIKIVDAQEELQKKIDKNNTTMTKTKVKNDNKCDSDEAKIFIKMADNAAGKLAILDALANCVLSFFIDIGGNCTDKNQQMLLDLAEDEAKLIVSLDKLRDKCAFNDQKANIKNAENNNKAADSAAKKIAKADVKIQGYESDIALLEKDLDIFNNQLIACGSAPLSC